MVCWFRSLTIDTDNVEGDDPFQVMETVIHETQHQYQHYLVENPDKRPEHISEETIQSWKENFDNYISPRDDYEGYRKQPVEQDARDTADEVVNDYLANDEVEA